MVSLLSSAPLGAAYQYSLFFLLLMLYSFLGWCGEMVYCSLGQRRLCEKRGFLNGPICPIYGHGALLVLLTGGYQTPLETFLIGAIQTSAVEYLTSYLMEKLFHMRAIDVAAFALFVRAVSATFLYSLVDADSEPCEGLVDIFLRAGNEAV